jgi:nucleotide-binding universal stress UspA family protein
VGAKLSVIHAIPEEQLDSAGSRDARRRVDELLKTAGCEATVRIATGPVKKALLQAARQSDADALIIGRKPRSGVLGRMRDLTYALIRESPFPVLSV